MKMSNFFSEDEFLKIQSILPRWEFSKEYSDEEIDIFDEEIERMEQLKGFESEDGRFLGDMINKFRNNPKYA
ncbi:hypothetical protein [Streptococcus cuniculi]|nr:hypothetical protein [Streptococcus cuniculi]